MRNLMMDGFLSAIMAAESFEGSRAILHGPGGCSDYSTRISSMIVPRDHKVIKGPYFFNNPRVPCTFVDEEDYVNGADYKVTELLNRIDDAELCVIVQSPGMSLIGDDLNGAAYRSSFRGKTVVIGNSHMSEPAHMGYDITVSEIVKGCCSETERKKGKVNLIGIPVIMHGWETTAEELESYLNAMGLELCAVVGGGCSVDQLKDSSSAEFNITVLPEFSRATADAYSSIGVPTLFTDIPVGFENTRKWINSVAERAGADPSPALDLLRKSELRAKRLLEGSSFKGFSARCATYSVNVDSELVIPLMEWLYRYLFMFPESVVIRDWWSDGYRAKLTEFLESINRPEVITNDIDTTRVDVMFSDGISAEFMQKKGVCSAGIDMWMPSMHSLQFVEKPILGAKGALRLLDDIFYLIQRGMYH
ncbi:MAG: hypothetical protein IJF47_03030 [Candidatus Methanomethylophilaceae archaeon]|nr:hypothetical protein [Candidatus Methanomethylophilaceae archaeon]